MSSKTEEATVHMTPLAKRDYISGVLIILIGTFGVFQGYAYGIGTPACMGPGFFPLLIGALLGVVGVLILLGARLAQDDAEDPEDRPPQWLAWACIVASPIAFILLGRWGGLLPATFGSVFIASLGDKDMNLKQSIGLASVIAIIGVLIFSLFLKIPFPVIRGVWQ